MESGGKHTHSILLKSAAAVLLLLLICGVFCTAAAGLYGESGNIHWLLDSHHTLTISGHGSMPDYTTEAYHQAPWREGPSNADNHMIEHVVIESGVTTIGNYAFYGCQALISVSIPSSVTSIGEYAFFECRWSLTSITIPEGVTTIHKGAFRRCSSLSSITLPSSITSIGTDAFSDLAGDCIVYYSGPCPPGGVTNARDNGDGSYTFSCGSSRTFSDKNAPNIAGFTGWYDDRGNLVTSISNGDDYATGKKPLYTAPYGNGRGYVPNDFTPWDKTDRLPTAAGRYILQTDVRLLDSWTVPAGETVLDLNGHTLIDSPSSYGLVSKPGTILIDSGSTLILQDYKFSGTNSGAVSGKNGQRLCGIFVMGNLILVSGKISDFNQNAVVIGQGGKAIMYGGEITNNHAAGSTSSGEQNILYNAGTFIMKRGNISDNTAINGAVIHNAGRFEMTGGNITNNEAQISFSALGALYSSTIRNTGTFIMSGGEISHNRVKGCGGGLYVDVTGVAELKGNAKITDNAADIFGGGIFINADGTRKFGRLTLSEYVEISGNRAGFGGGIYAGGVGQSPSLTVNDKVRITDNTAKKGAGVYLSSSTLYMNGGTISDNRDENLYEENGNVELKPGAVIEFYGHYHPVCGASCTHGGADKNVTWIPISSIEELRNIYSAGYYYLTKDITIDGWYSGDSHHQVYHPIDSWHPPDGVVLCLNGHALRYNTRFIGDQQNIIVVDKGCTFTLTDCKPEATNTIYYPAVNENGTLKTKEVVIYERVPAGNLRYPYIYDMPEFKQKTVSGGVITGGVPTPDKLVYNSGDGWLKPDADKKPYSTAVKVDGGTFTMYGGTICGCFAKEDGGGVCTSSAVITWDIKESITIVKGGSNEFRYMDMSTRHVNTVNLLGGTISDNVALKNGGGIAMQGCVYTIDGTSITNNTAKENGGGIVMHQVYSKCEYLDKQQGKYVVREAYFPCTGLFKAGSITGNTAKVNGGGAYVDTGGYIKVEGTAELSNNKGSDLYLTNKNQLTLSGKKTGNPTNVSGLPELIGEGKQFGTVSSNAVSETDARQFVSDGLWGSIVSGKLQWITKGAPNANNMESGSKEGNVFTFTTNEIVTKVEVQKPEITNVSFTSPAASAPSVPDILNGSKIALISSPFNLTTYNSTDPLAKIKILVLDEKAVTYFQVNESDLGRFQPENVSLLHLNESKWQILKATYCSLNGTYYQFNASTPLPGTFAVAAVTEFTNQSVEEISGSSVTFTGKQVSSVTNLNPPVNAKSVLYADISEAELPAPVSVSGGGVSFISGFMLIVLDENGDQIRETTGGNIIFNISAEELLTDEKTSICLAQWKETTDKWELLNTSKSGNEYEAHTDSFSPFAVIRYTKIETPKPEPQPEAIEEHETLICDGNASIPYGTTATAVTNLSCENGTLNYAVLKNKPAISLEEGYEVFSGFSIEILDENGYKISDWTSGDIVFKVDAAKVSQPANVRLAHLASGAVMWEMLAAEFIGEYGGELYFSAHTNSFSPFAIIIPVPEQPQSSSSSSRDYGASVWLPATAEPTPTAEATPEPALAQPAASPVNQPPQQASTPAPAAGIIAGLGAAGIIAVMRRK